MARRAGSKGLVITRLLREWVDEAEAAVKERRELPRLRVGRLRYRLRKTAGREMDQRGLTHEETFGDMKDPRRGKSILTGHLNQMLAARGRSYADVGLVAGSSGHMSNEAGEMVAYRGGQEVLEGVVLFVEKLDVEVE